MSTAIANPPTLPTAPLPLQPPPGYRYYLAQSAFRKFTLDEYHKLIEIGVLIDGEPYELLEGNLVRKMPRGTPHDSAIDRLEGEFLRVLPPDWFPRSQRAVTLAQSDSEPEPDIAVVPGPRNRYTRAHPAAAELGIVVEVSDSSLAIDRHDKNRIYAAEGIPVYWVVNIPEKQIEVYTQPAGTGDDAAYTRRDDFSVGTSVPVVLGAATVGAVAVSEVLG